VAAGLAVLLDQITKVWILAHLALPGAKPLVLVPGCLKLEYATNSGAAFSLFYDHPEILTATALILAVGVLAWGLAFLKPHERLAHVAGGLIFGGAMGNLIDRLRLGHVVDFVVAYWGDHAWPTFNVADSAICVGVGVLVLVLGRTPREAVAPAQGAAAGGPAPAAGEQVHK
jgi:signal peptidase II